MERKEQSRIDDSNWPQGDRGPQVVHAVVEQYVMHVIPIRFERRVAVQDTDQKYPQSIENGDNEHYHHDDGSIKKGVGVVAVAYIQA